MPTRRRLLAGLMLLVTAVPAISAEQSVQDFLSGIYGKYKGRDAKGAFSGKPGEYARYFTPSLAALIEADAQAAAKRGDVPTLDGDPFVDAQDWDIRAFAIETRESGADKAVGTVKFRNVEENVSMTLDLVKTKDGWRVDDIRGPRRKSLRALFHKS